VPAHAHSASNGRGPKKAEALAQLLLERGLDTGAMLPTEMVLCREYNVGRNTVREAQRILEVHGALEINTGAGGGAAITVPDSRDYGRTASFFFRAAGVRARDLLEARNIMEPLAARLAAEHPTEAGIERLRKLVATLEAGPQPDNREFLDAARTFHDAVNSISDNPAVNLFTSALVHMLVDRLVVSLPEQRREDVHHIHIEIGRAILDGDGDAAERLMRHHIAERQVELGIRNDQSLDEVISWR
jgi:GntR family transcriptional repressor for pyruvate dehydrogenase complex